MLWIRIRHYLYGSRSFHYLAKKQDKPWFQIQLDLWLLYGFFSQTTDANIPSKSNILCDNKHKTLKEKNLPYFLLASWEPLTKRTGSGSGSETVSGSDPRIRIRTKISRIYNTAAERLPKHQCAVLVCKLIEARGWGMLRWESNNGLCESILNWKWWVYTTKDYAKYVQPHFLDLSNLFDIVLKLAVLLFSEFVESFNTVGTFLQKTIKASVNKTFYDF